MSHPNPQMNVLKRDGSFEPVNLQKIVKAITRSAEGIESVDPSRVAIKTIAGLYDGATTTELDLLSIQTAASLIPENGAYSKLAAALQIEVLRKECALQGIHSFSQSVDRAQHLGLVSEAIATFVTKHQRKLDAAVKDAYNRRFEFFGLQNVAKHLLLRDPISGRVIETPQFYLLRLAVTRSLDSVRSAIERYQEFANSDDPTHVPQWHETSLVPFVLPDPCTTLPPTPAIPASHCWHGASSSRAHCVA